MCFINYINFDNTGLCEKFTVSLLRTIAGPYRAVPSDVWVSVIMARPKW